VLSVDILLFNTALLIAAALLILSGLPLFMRFLKNTRFQSAGAQWLKPRQTSPATRLAWARSIGCTNRRLMLMAVVVIEALISPSDEPDRMT
jgi:hypothetical protein